MLSKMGLVLQGVGSNPWKGLRAMLSKMGLVPASLSMSAAICLRAMLSKMGLVLPRATPLRS